MQRRGIIGAVVAIGFLGALFVPFSGVIALEYGGFGGRPAFPRPDNPRTESIFIHTLKPGQTQAEGVMVINNTNTTRTLMVYAVDSTPSSGGAFACEQLSETKDDVGAWVILAREEVTVDANKKNMVPFDIKVPESAGVGEHNGCIIVEEKKVKKAGQAGVNISTRTGLRIAITIPGTITKKIEIAGLTVVPASGKLDGFAVKPAVKNTGNVSIDTNVVATVRFPFGLSITELGGQFPVLRGETANWSFDLPRPFFGGFYRASFYAEYDSDPATRVGEASKGDLQRVKSSSVWFFARPTILGMIVEILALIAAIVLYRLYKLSRQRQDWIRTAWVEYEVQPGDDIKSLADRFDVSWKLLAAANKIEPPYALRPGATIKAPPLESK